MAHSAIRRLSCLLLIVAASGGCRACSDCYDYGSPVAPGPYSSTGSRAGSAFAGTTQQGAGEVHVLEATFEKEAEETAETQLNYDLQIEPARFQVQAVDVSQVRPVASARPEPARPKVVASPIPEAKAEPAILAEPALPNEPTVTKLPPLFTK